MNKQSNNNVVALPIQHELLFINDNKNTTNIFESYSSLPRHINGKFQKSTTDTNKMEYSKPVLWKNERCTMTITAGLVKRIDKETGSEVKIGVFPSYREFLVEQVLIKLAANGAIRTLKTDEYIYGLNFSIKQIRDELAKTNHTYSHYEIIEALKVMQSSRITLTKITNGADKKDTPEVSDQFIQTLILSSSSENNEAATCSIRFNAFMNDAIASLSYRQTNFPRLMSLRTQLAAYTYTRLLDRWRGAGKDSAPYLISMTSFLNESNTTISERNSNNKRKMIGVLDELVDKGVLEKYESVDIKEGRKLVDVRFYLYPSDDFIKEMIISNKHQKKIVSLS